MPQNHLQELYQSLQVYISIDESDWLYLSNFAIKWHLSIADAILDMHLIDETSLAKALAAARKIPYLTSKDVLIDYASLTFDSIEDLLSVGALPVSDSQLAIFNPYDDHRGLLRPDLASREMVVTERSPLYEKLHDLCLLDWTDSRAELLPQIP